MTGTGEKFESKMEFERLKMIEWEYSFETWESEKPFSINNSLSNKGFSEYFLQISGFQVFLLRFSLFQI
jgi:hypothetical protein